MFKFLFASFLFLNFSMVSFAIETNEITFHDKDDHELVVEVYPAKGKYLQIWLTRHFDERLMFENMIAETVKSGIEVWRINLIHNYFLPESSDSVDKLSGTGVSALIANAIKTGKKVIVSAYDRMSLVALKGVHLWQSSENYNKQSYKSFLGSILFYPNFYNVQNIAGLAPDLNAIIKHSNLPIVVYQPKFGGHINHIEEIFSTLWNSDSSSFIQLVPDVRDWFFMHALENENRTIKATEAEKIVTAKIPYQLVQFFSLLESVNEFKPAIPFTIDHNSNKEAIVGLKTFPLNSKFKPDLNFKLSDFNKKYRNKSDLVPGTLPKVTIVNFWASWCPPCVEEIPSLNKLQSHYLSNYPGNTFELISINFQENANDIEAFLKKVSVEFPVLMDINGLVSDKWHIFALPSSFILDKNGKVRYSINRGIDWNSDEVKSIIDSLIFE
ncbi:MAG: TlpA family protein disulfide reductase [Gammaproteobacteria bacterium]|nr:TlpA family protein disulfide reductase [Gammaproteobacteria bacterium]